MNIPYIIQLLQNKINVLTNAKSQAESVGDLNQINEISKELLDTQSSFSQLMMLSDMNQAASNASVTAAQVMTAGLNVVQGITPVAVQTQGPSAGAIINGYDISAYATDPLYEQKIQNIINAMPTFYSAQDVDNYIHNQAQTSPLNGNMVWGASQEYFVDIPLLVAIMQNDSDFGTLGVGATTNNPGNVGNTGSATHTYDSWTDGVNAVASWLSRHRATQETTLQSDNATAIADAGDTAAAAAANLAALAAANATAATLVATDTTTPSTSSGSTTPSTPSTSSGQASSGQATTPIIPAATTTSTSTTTDTSTDTTTPPAPVWPDATTPSTSSGQASSGSATSTPAVPDATTTPPVDNSATSSPTTTDASSTPATTPDSSAPSTDSTGSTGSPQTSSGQASSTSAVGQ